MIMKKILLFILLFLLFASCQRDYGSDWKDSMLMDRSSIEFSSEASSCEIHVIPSLNEHVRLYGIVDSGGSIERISQSERYYDKNNQIQSRIFNSMPWMTVKAHAGSEHADLMDDYTVAVEQNTSGSMRTCMLVFVTEEMKQVVVVVQR